MTAIWLMLLQSEAVSAPPAPAATVRFVPDRDCEPNANGDIVICASPGDAYRLKPLPDRYRAEEGLPAARHVLGDGSTLSAETEQVIVGGFPSNRLMLRWRKGF